MEHNAINYTELQKLDILISNDQATSKDERRFMELLYLKGSISENEYQEFLDSKDDKDIRKKIITGGLALAGAALFGYILGRIADK